MTLLLFYLQSDPLQEIARARERTAALVAEYAQSKRGAVTDEDLKSVGKVCYRREPYCMRWEETGGGSIVQIEQDRYVAVHPKTREVEIIQLNALERCLAGILSGAPPLDLLVEHFDVKPGVIKEPEVELKLLPRSDGAKGRLKEARLVLSTRTWLLTAVAWVEIGGGTGRVTFTKAQVVESLDAKSFELDLDSLRRQGYSFIERK